MGDFGISKMLTTGRKEANTVVGTPYYISPEMVSHFYVFFPAALILADLSM